MVQLLDRSEYDAVYERNVYRVDILIFQGTIAEPDIHVVLPIQVISGVTQWNIR